MLLIFSVVQYFFAASVGSDKRLNSLGVGGPVIVWVGLYFVMQVLFFVFMLIPVGLAIDDGSLRIVSENYLGALANAGDLTSVPIGVLPGVVLGSIALIWRTLNSWQRHISLV